MNNYEEVQAQVALAWGKVYHDIPEAQEAWNKAEEAWGDFLKVYEALTDEEYNTDPVGWDNKYQALYDAQDNAKYRIEALKAAEKALRKACQAIDDLVDLA